MNTISHCLNFLDQTAALRFSPKWEDVRQLLVTRECSAEQMILLSCDNAGGPDMCLWFALADGTIVQCVLRKDASSLRYDSIVEWRTATVSAENAEWLLAQRITTTSDLAAAFAKAVKSFYDFSSRCT